MYRKYIKFTLIELVMVVAITAILMALLMPTLISVRTGARITNEKSNLKQIYQAIIYYSEANNEYFPYINSIESDADNVSKTIWLLLPYINYDTRIISPKIKRMNGRAIYNDILTDPTATPIPGLSYSPIYERDENDTEILRFTMKNIPKSFPVVCTPLNKYANKIIYLTFDGDVR